MVLDTHVVILEDDPYARDMIAMMLSRDWRTRVVAETGTRDPDELKRLLAPPNPRVDVLVVDTEVPEDPAWPDRVLEILASLEEAPVVVFTCTYPNPRRLKGLLAAGASSGGYLVKSEIAYSLATAVVYAARGHFVVSPGVRVLEQGELKLPPNTRVLSGANPVADFTQRETDIVRLGVLFNLAQRDIADELVISTHWVAEAIVNIYEKLNLRDIVSGDIPLIDYFDDPILLERCRAILERGGTGRLRKAPWISTLAFHLLTVPEIEYRLPEDDHE